MSKFTILCGVKDRFAGRQFMCDVLYELNMRGRFTTVKSYEHLVIETANVRVAFIYDVSKQPLYGIRADAIFGRDPYWKPLAPYAKPLAEYVRDLGLGLVDYIERYENLCEFKRLAVSKISNPFAIKKVIFNAPATVVFWEDGTKTVVKCQKNDIYDPEKGIAMAISRKALGNKRDYYNIFKRWLKKCK